MEDGFKWVDPRNIPIITIAKYGIMFSPGAVEMLGNPPYIMIGYDREKKMVGVRPCQKETDRTILFTERDGYGRSNSRNAIRYIENELGVDFTETKRFIASWDNTGTFLVIDIRKPIENSRNINKNE